MIELSLLQRIKKTTGKVKLSFYYIKNIVLNKERIRGKNDDINNNFFFKNDNNEGSKNLNSKLVIF